MDEPTAWGKSRPIVFCIVLTVHLAMLALILVASRTRNIVSAAPFVELMIIPPTKPPPKVRAEKPPPQSLSTNVAIALAPPLLNSSLQPGPSSAPDGHGPAVNWTAEAHRAVRAYEIRRDQTSNQAISVSSLWDDWWPREHHAGDRFKTASGDWIVWISADCYQVASWHSGAVSAASPPQTVCPARSPAAHSD